MFKRLGAASLSAMLCLGISSCGGGAAGAGAVTVTCQPVTLIAPPTLTFPAAGATGVADGSFTLSMTWTQNPSTSGWLFSLQPASGAGIALSYFTAGATVGSATTYTTPVGALAANTTYTLTMSTTLNGCPHSQTFGSFTTQ